MKEANKIEPEALRELRALAHDLSNAIEAIVQANYLLSQTAQPDDCRRWIEMIDKASQEAAQINRKLREVLRSQ
jgi:hypothetical protein